MISLKKCLWEKRLDTLWLVVLKMLIEGKLNKFGVLAPEACGIDPDNFFQELGSISRSCKDQFENYCLSKRVFS